MARKRKRRLVYLAYFFSNVPAFIGWKVFHIKPKNSFQTRNSKRMAKGNKALIDAIASNQPFAAIRFGATELSCFNGAEKIELGFAKTFKESARFAAKNNAGYFPTDDAALHKYAESFELLAGEADILGVYGLHMENYFAHTYCPKAKRIPYEAMEPLQGDWTKMLKGRKVLVISSFPAEIESQYQKRKKLFASDPNRLPDFELKTLQAPITFASIEPTSASFFEELKKVEDQMEEIDFDILLVGAGAYGSFLALKAKSLGKQGIQTGGATPTLFGIMGKRWENRPHVAKHVNEHWIRPYSKPVGYEKIEGGTYW